MKNLGELLDLQDELDQHIIKNMDQPPDEKFLLTSKFLSLVVEAGELANKSRCFKYWSRKKSDGRKILLEEFADILHFLLSLANHFGFSGQEIEEAYLQKRDINFQRQKNGY